jgi:hypothetical protein
MSKDCTAAKENVYKTVFLCLIRVTCHGTTMTKFLLIAVLFNPTVAQGMIK